MQTETVLLIILAAIVALLVVLFHYFFRAKNKGKLPILLGILRFLGVFGLLLLLINPKFSKTTYTVENPVLAILIDNSASVEESGEDIKTLLAKLENSTELNNRFSVDIYAFGSDLKPVDSLSFKDKLTDIEGPLSSLNDVYRKKQSATIIISDGNQNIGKDYTYSADTDKPVYTITVGDTTAYEDLSIGPLNTNKYAFLNNKFPLETYIQYQGKGQSASQVKITLDGNTIFSERISLSETNNLKNINTLIDASSVGLKNLKVIVSQMPSERNIKNNVRETTVEVIDEKTNIGIISQVLHPDLGALKKSIESNEQRKVHILKPNASQKDIDEMDIFILYEPTRSFNSLFEYIKNKKANYLVVTGINTDFNFLNSVQDDFKVELGYPTQEVFGNLNPSFPLFEISDFDIEDFPPLTSDAGPVALSSNHEILLETEVKGVNINSPMLSIVKEQTWKKGVWLGTDIWRWRAQSYLNYGDFSNFDSFIGKLVRYLSSNIKRERLNLEYNSLFEGSQTAVVRATYFDQAFLFDPNASININITNKESNEKLDRPMILQNGYYQADLSDLSPGAYSFTVNVEKEGLNKSGSFVISDFDLENQFVSSNYKKMATLATNTGGKAFFPSEENDLIQELIGNDAFTPTQKSMENVVSLIDYRILLAIIVLAFTTEWFLRKYNGLI